MLKLTSSGQFMALLAGGATLDRTSCAILEQSCLVALALYSQQRSKYALIGKTCNYTSWLTPLAVGRPLSLPVSTRGHANDPLIYPHPHHLVFHRWQLIAQHGSAARVVHR